MNRSNDELNKEYSINDLLDVKMFLNTMEYFYRCRSPYYAYRDILTLKVLLIARFIEKRSMKECGELIGQRWESTSGILWEALRDYRSIFGKMYFRK
ncbi:MAG: hypothetical protein ABIJ57_09500 [Pseudomonadota bacterium]